MEELLGSKLLPGVGAELVDTAAALSGAEVVGLYFSAHWCPPCRGYTPQLAATYKELTAAGKPFKLVFLSSDRDEDSFNEYFGGEMEGWHAVPFAERGIKEKLSSKYSVRGIPSLVLVDGQTGELITKKGRNVVTTTPEAFPWKPPTLRDMLSGDDFMTSGSDERSALTHAGPTLLYFSAHWCPPCQNFTPAFSKVYKLLKAAGKEFEVVYVSSDREQDQFDEYYGSMPWRAIPYARRDLKEALSSHFEIEGIPSLVVLDAPDADGERAVINTNAVGLVMKDETGANFPWPKPLVGDLDEDADDINVSPSIVALMEKAEEHWDAVEEALTEAAKVLKGSGVKFYKATEVGGIGGQVRKLCKLASQPGKTPEMVLLDLGDRGGYYNVPEGQAITKESVVELVKAFKAGGLERQQASKA